MLAFQSAPSPSIRAVPSGHASAVASPTKSATCQPERRKEERASGGSLVLLRHWYCHHHSRFQQRRRRCRCRVLLHQRRRHRLLQDGGPDLVEVTQIIIPLKQINPLIPGVVILISNNNHN